MKENNKADAISHIDDDLLDSALLMRQSLQNQQVARKAERKLALRKMAAVAACVAVLGTSVTIAVVAAPADAPEETTTVVGVVNPDGPYGRYVDWADLVWVRHTKDEVYAMESYNLYLPTLVEDLNPFDAYVVDQEEKQWGWPERNIPIVAEDSMRIVFANPEESDYLLRIHVYRQPLYRSDSFYVRNDHVTFDVNYEYVPYDITDIESYERINHELSYYSSENLAEARKHKVFLAQDVTLEVIQNLYHDTTLFASESELSAEDETVIIDESIRSEPFRIYDKLYDSALHTYVKTTVQGYRYDFRMTILLDNDYTITYAYYGNDITPEMMYDIIMSAPYFAE